MYIISIGGWSIVSQRKIWMGSAVDILGNALIGLRTFWRIDGIYQETLYH